MRAPRCQFVDVTGHAWFLREPARTAAGHLADLDESCSCRIDRHRIVAAHQTHRTVRETTQRVFRERHPEPRRTQRVRKTRHGPSHLDYRGSYRRIRRHHRCLRIEFRLDEQRREKSAIDTEYEFATRRAFGRELAKAITDGHQISPRHRGRCATIRPPHSPRHSRHGHDQHDEQNNDGRFHYLIMAPTESSSGGAMLCGAHGGAVRSDPRPARLLEMMFGVHSVTMA